MDLRTEWEINDVLNTREDGKWDLKKNWYSGVEFTNLNGKVKGKGGKSIYKLVLKKEITTDSKDDFSERGIKGGFGLIKATWNGSKKWDLKEEIIGDKNKVWLIMAQGQNNIYLMPSVRTSRDCGWTDEEWEKKQEKKGKQQIEQEGVKDITDWTRKYDRIWGKREKEGREFQKSESSGFSITRTVEIAEWEWKAGGATYKAEENAVSLMKKLRINESLAIRNGGKIKFLYKNAGILNLENMNSEAKSCHEVEHYFPLDLVILGDSKDKIQTENKNNEQIIKITDDIKEVIGVRLDQVVISKEGIGDSSGRLLFSFLNKNFLIYRHFPSRGKDNLSWIG